jgi:phosphate starvation-inducible PhoH-like protein
MIDIPAEHERNVFGQFDAYAKKLERTFHVTLIAREGKVKILGEDKNAEKGIGSACCSVKKRK